MLQPTSVTEENVSKSVDDHSAGEVFTMAQLENVTV